MPAVQMRQPGLLTRIRNLERMREIAVVAVRHGFGYLLERHRLLGLLPRRRRRRYEPPTQPGQRGRHIREMLEELGPTFIKFGQLLSTRPDIVPPDIIEELVKLQDAVSPFEFAVAKTVVEEDIGLRLERAFQGFDPVPLASASIGQVHAAVLPGGQQVVVKVQRPEAASQIRKDVDVLFQFAEMLEGRVAPGISLVGIVEEFARSIERELDYVLETRNAIRFAANFRDSDTVHIPRVYTRYCSTRVITMERIQGPTLNSSEVAGLPLDKRKALAEVMSSCWFKQILHDGFFHADPHPANVVYLGECRIGLLDFGMAGSLGANDLEEGTRLFLHMMRRDSRGVKRSLRRLGLRWAPAVDGAVTEALEDAFNRYYGVSLKSIDWPSLFRQLFNVVRSLHLRLPTRFLLLDKALLTLEGVVTQLYPDFNVFEAAGQYTGELKQRLYDPRNVSNRMQRSAAEYAQMISEYPTQLYGLLEELRAGELEVKYRHTGLDDMIHRLDVITNRLVVALITIALGVASTAVAILVEGGPHIGGLSVWGLPGFAGSLFFGAWLIYAIIRSGRL